MRQRVRPLLCTLVVPLCYGALNATADGDRFASLHWADAVCAAKPACSRGSQSLLLVSLDGLRADYLERGVTPSLRAFARCAARAAYVAPSFPSSTFPNHYSIVTGLYPESHGIVDNGFYDMGIGKAFTKADMDPVWWRGEPIWTTVQRNGGRAASYFWPGSDKIINGTRPNEWYPYKSGVPMEHRVDTVVGWLASTEPLYDFVTMYYHEPDRTGHAIGADDSGQLNAALAEADSWIAVLMGKLHESRLLPCVNVAVVSDHGMQTVTGRINMNDYVDPAHVLYARLGPVASIVPHNDSDADRIIAALGGGDCARDPRSNLAVYGRGDAPRYLHYRSGRRIAPVTALAKPPFALEQSADSARTGEHGYDPRYDSMRTVFMAAGPRFRLNITVPPFQNVELYNLFADVLRLRRRAANNGTAHALDALLAEPFLADTVALKVLPPKARPCNRDWHSDSTVDYTPPLATRSSARIQCPTLGVQVSPLQCYLGPSWVQVDDWRGGPLLTRVTQRALAACAPPSAKRKCRQYANILPNMGRLQCALWTVHGAGVDGIVALAIDPETLAVLESQLAKWASSKLGRVSVVIGQIFDYDNDGLADDASAVYKRLFTTYGVPIPSDLFTVALRWGTGNNSGNSCAIDDVYAVAVPNRADARPRCMAHSDYIASSTCRLGDVEQLSGLAFFQHCDYADAVRLRVRLPPQYASGP